MRRPSRRWTFAAAALGGLVAVPAAFLAGLSYQPEFYRARVALHPERRAERARRFVAQSLQLRNDIVNEPRWEAAFSDEEVNAWLAQDLVAHFADRIPPGVSDPRIAFEADRATLAFRLDQGRLRSLIWVVVRVHVPEPNVLALTIEKIRAGLVPVSSQALLDNLTTHGRAYGLDIRWDTDDGLPMALIRYRPDRGRRDVVLDRLLLLEGQIRLMGHSEDRRGVSTLKLPGLRSLQSTFPKRTVQPAAAPPVSLLRSSTPPASAPPSSRSSTRPSPHDRTS